MNFSQSSVKKYPFRDTLFTTIIVTGRDKKKTHLCKSYRRKISPPPPQTNTDLRLLRGLKSDINEEIEHFRPILLIIGPRTFKFTAEYIMLIRTEVRNALNFPRCSIPPRGGGVYISGHGMAISFHAAFLSYSPMHLRIFSVSDRVCWPLLISVNPVHELISRTFSLFSCWGQLCKQGSQKRGVQV